MKGRKINYQSRVRDFFDCISDDCEDVWYPTPYSWYLNDILININVDRRKVLDVGCGAGNLAFSACDRGGLVSASDISEVSVSRAKEIARDLNLSITIVQSDGLEHWINVGEKFDIVICNPPSMDLLSDNIKQNENPFHNSHLLVDVLEKLPLVCNKNSVFVSVVSGLANMDFVESKLPRGSKPFVVKKNVAMAGLIPERAADLEALGLVVQKRGKFYWDAYFFGIFSF